MRLKKRIPGKPIPLFFLIKALRASFCLNSATLLYKSTKIGEGRSLWPARQLAVAFRVSAQGAMSVEQAATAETALAGAPAKRGESWIVGPLVVGMALFSAFVTFIVLACLTPVSPTHTAVLSLLLVNAATVLDRK